MLKRLFGGQCRRHWPLLILLIITLLTYWNSLNVPYQFDDSLHLFYTKEVINNLPASEAFDKMVEYRLRSLPMLSFYAQFKIWPEHPLWFVHSVNIFIHLLATAFVYILTLQVSQLFLKQQAQLTQKGKKTFFPPLPYLAFFVAGVFALHPVQTQAVTYLIQRMASMAGMFFLLAVVIFLHLLAKQIKNHPTLPHNKNDENLAKEKNNNQALNIKSKVTSNQPFEFLRKFLRLLKKLFRSIGKFATPLLLVISIIVAGSLALYSKQNTAVLPIILFFTVLLFSPLFFWLKNFNFKPIIILLLPIVALSLLVVYEIFVVSQHFQTDGMRQLSTRVDRAVFTPYTYGLTQFALTPAYLGLLIAPINQTIDHYPPIIESPNARVIIGAFIYLILVILSVYAWVKRQTLIAFGLGWYLITMLVESSFIPIADAFNEHRLYLPIIGMTLAVSGAVILVAQKYQVKKVFAIVPVCILIFLAFLTFNRNIIWQHPLALWDEARQLYPDNPRAQYNYAINLIILGKPELAIPELHKVLEIMPSHSMTLNQLGVLYFGTKDFETALKYFAQAESYAPNDKLYQRNVDMTINLLERQATQSGEIEVELDPEQLERMLEMFK